jgi:probable rRNA maturation factor
MVSILFQSESHYPVDKNKIKQAITLALETKIHQNVEVSVSVVGDRQMRRLNKTYRDIDAPTDVLSFPLSETSESAIPFVDTPDNILRLGDIVISYPQAVDDAAETNKMVDDMLVELALHGLNHLLGIHHPE